MKKLTGIAIIIAILILSFISCAENPKEKIIGKWVTSPDNEIKDAPINIINSDTALIFGQPFTLQYGDIEDGIQKGTINGPMGMGVDFEYDVKNDVFTIVFMGGNSEYVRFEGTDEEWEKLSNLILRQQQEGYVRMNMYAIDNIMKEYYSVKQKYPSNTKYIKEQLQGKIQNPINLAAEFVIMGNKVPEFNTENLGMVYIRTYNNNKKYEIYGFGFDSLLHIPKIDSDIKKEMK